MVVLYPLIIVLIGTGVIYAVYDVTLVSQLIIIWAWFCLIFGAGFFPDIYLDEADGIKVQFLFLRLRLSWSDITGIKEIRFPFHRWNFWVVKTTKLTPFHFLYGLSGWTLSRSFIIWREMDNHSELIALISTHIRKNLVLPKNGPSPRK